jgi:hypothetical protein
VAEQRVIFEEMMAAIPVPADVTTSSGSLGGIPVVDVEVAGADHSSADDARPCSSPIAGPAPALPRRAVASVGADGVAA